jgi:hypothetical protein
MTGKSFKEPDPEEMMDAVLSGLSAMTPYVQGDGSIQSEFLAEAFREGLLAALLVLTPFRQP